MTIPFTSGIQYQALTRQRNKCAGCGEPISDIGKLGAPDHPYGEAVQGHHVIPFKLGGPNTVENCVILCISCHINAHAGGSFRDVSMYDNLKNVPMNRKIQRIADLYSYYTGVKRKVRPN